MRYFAERDEQHVDTGWMRRHTAMVAALALTASLAVGVAAQSGMAALAESAPQPAPLTELPRGLAGPQPPVVLPIAPPLPSPAEPAPEDSGPEPESEPEDPAGVKVILPPKSEEGLGWELESGRQEEPEEPQDPDDGEEPGSGDEDPDWPDLDDSFPGVDWDQWDWIDDDRWDVEDWADEDRWGGDRDKPREDCDENRRDEDRGRKSKTWDAWPLDPWSGHPNGR